MTNLLKTQKHIYSCYKESKNLNPELEACEKLALDLTSSFFVAAQKDDLALSIGDFMQLKGKREISSQEGKIIQKRILLEKLSLKKQLVYTFNIRRDCINYYCQLVEAISKCSKSVLLKLNTALTMQTLFETSD